MQARRMDDPAARAALEESVRRVASIAVVHETLSTALEEKVDFDAIADKVLAMCAEVATTGMPVRVARAGSFGVLDADLATSLAMALTELVQNAVEHAYPDGREGHIEVLVDRAPHALVVEVVDDGAGLPPGFDLAASPRLGLQIVRTLVGAELGGSLVLEPGQPRGTRAVLRMPLPG
jgi:two-component sensor histidine kinase